MEQEIKKNTPRDVFLHLLAVVTLYWSAITFVMLLWQYINYYFPDALNYYFIGINGSMKFAVSCLIIVFPVFVAVSWYLNKIYRREAVVRESKIRKWLIYLTLFIASLVIIGDLVTVINNLLGGEPTARFILKALSVLLVAGFVFGYYLDDVRRDSPTRLGKLFAWGSGVLVLAAIIGAFFIVGSPTTARLINFDQQKVSDLQSIQSQIVNYYQRKGVLPNYLSDLNDSISGFVAPTDPQTKSNYEYVLQSQATLSFELCSTFNKALSSTQGLDIPIPIPAGQGWDHPAGHFCFDKTIDKQLYPPLNLVK